MLVAHAGTASNFFFELSTWFNSYAIYFNNWICTAHFALLDLLIIIVVK